MRFVSELRIAKRRNRKTPPATSAVRGFLSIRDGADKVPYQSDLERQFLVVCACLPWVSRVTWEPMTLHFLDNSTQLRRSYTPDFLVEYQSGYGTDHQLLVETKRQNDWSKSAEHMRACYAAAELWAEMQTSAAFLHVSDEWLSDIHFPTYEFIFAARKGAISQSSRRKLVKGLLNQSRLTMLSATKWLKAQGITDYNQAMATLMALVSDGYIGFDIAAPLTMETRVDGKPIANPFVTAASRAGSRQG